MRSEVQQAHQDEDRQVIKSIQYPETVCALQSEGSIEDESPMRTTVHSEVKEAICSSANK